MRIVDALVEVLKENESLTYKEAYVKIIERDLYQFGTKEPEAAVNAKLRCHCEGLDFPGASPVKYFKIMESYVQTLPDDEKILPQLINALRNRKPFANFGRIINNSYLRNEWFKFKQQWLDNLVAGQLLVELDKLKENNNDI